LTMAEDVRTRVQALGEEIRTLKASLKERGLSSSAINGDKSVQALVAELRELKTQLPQGDELSDQAFFERQRKEQEEREQQRRLRAEEERRLLQSMESSLEMPLVQRKIFHLFQCAGSGDSFHYEPPPRLNAEQTGFGSGEEPCPGVYVTEKWDGTTMQATSSAIFRRQEIVGKKRSKNPSQRYELKLVAWRDKTVGGSGWRGFDFIDADKRVAEALAPHLARIEAMDSDLCVYFECVHTNINVTYSHIQGFADIRVFDFSRKTAKGSWREGSFLPFDETVVLSQRLELPLVGWERRPLLEAAELWAELEAAKHRHYAAVEAPLEGFVVREIGGPRIAKACVEHMKRESVGTAGGALGASVVRDLGASRQGSAAAEGAARCLAAGVGAGALAASDRLAYLSMGHLEAIGLLPPGWGKQTANVHLVLRAPWDSQR